jgi:tripartite-type tricarboxylate transporter receptor subunit TctC
MMKLPRRQFLRLAAGAAVLPTASRFAWAQTYPTRPVRLVVGFAPGGVVDIVARLIGQSLPDRLGQAFIIEKRPGAGINIATEAVVRAQGSKLTRPHLGAPRPPEYPVEQPTRFELEVPPSPRGARLISPAQVIRQHRFRDNQ